MGDLRILSMKATTEPKDVDPLTACRGEGPGFQYDHLLNTPESNTGFEPPVDEWYNC